MTQQEVNNNQVKNDYTKMTKAELVNYVNEITADNDKLCGELEKLSAECESNKDKWYRTTAEFENFKKRNSETRKNAYEDGKIDAIKKLLFIGDNLDRAVSFELDDATKQGIEMLIKQYDETMSSLGLEVVNPIGQQFDPEIHEAIFSREAESGEESGTIDSVYLKGYKMGEKMIRYAQVVVIK